jgi:type II secretory pathway pseudopilin PulG
MNLLLKQKGLTLVEILLSVTMMTSIATLGMVAFRSLQVRNDLDTAVTITIQSLRRAQVLAQSADSDNTWGVRLQTSNIILFKGASYAARLSAFDETFTISPVITFSGVTEVVYSKVFGEPNTSGTLTLSSLDSESRTISINSKGMLDF